MPDFTMASAMLLIMSSLTLQPNLFQLFQPIGGVRAKLAEGACCLELVAGWAEADATNIKNMSATIRTDLIGEPECEFFECPGKAEMILQVADEIPSVFQRKSPP